MQGRSLAIWTFAVTSVALVMVMLDNLVVSTALNVIRQELGATIEQLEWTVNAYTLTFAVFLLTGAALGDRFGRKRMFIIGVVIFTAASAFAAMSTSVEMLLAGRMAQGIGAAIVTPLTLTLLSASVVAERRGVALGAWGAVGGLAIAVGPLVGGAIVEGVAWNWIFWVNVPIGIALIPLAWFGLRESRGPAGRLDLPGVGLASVGLFGVVWALINGNGEGWSSPIIIGAFAAGVAFLVAFLLWERRAAAPMLPPQFFKSRAFSFANLSAMLMSFGMFGAIFLLVQFLQFARLYSPLEAGLAILPWTLAPMFVAPIAGALSDRIGGGLLMGTGLTLQAIGLAWLGLVSSTTVEYTAMVVPFIISGIGMGLFFAPMANVILSAVKPQEEGQASGASNAIRELGGVFGVAVLAAVFSRQGSFQNPQAFVDGMVPAVLIGAVFVGVGAVAAFAIPRTRRASASDPEAVSGAAAPAASAPGGLVNVSGVPAPGDAAPAYVTIDD
jgi:EmrB/QacA subfamily drug resistance transporter